MKIKLIILLGAIIAILFVALFSFGLKEKALKGMVEDIPEYNCGNEGICTSCIIEGNSCSCGQSICECGNMTVDKKECDIT